MKLIRPGIDTEIYKFGDLMESITVSESILTNIITVSPQDKVAGISKLIDSTNHRGFPVVSDSLKLEGMITREDVNKALRTGPENSRVMDYMSKDLIVCYPDESLKTALHKMAGRNVGRLPVVDR